MRQVGGGLGVWDIEVGGGDGGEETDQAEEGEGEEGVDAEGGDEQCEADEGPAVYVRIEENIRTIDLAYMVMLWNPWEALYGAPRTPPSFVKALAAAWIGS